MSNGCLINLNAEPHWREGMPFRISYGEDVLKAKRVLQDVFATDSRVLQTPPSEVYVKKHGDSSINLLFRVWVKQAVYWAVFFNMHEPSEIRL